MKLAILLAIAIVILSSLPVVSHHDDAVAQGRDSIDAAPAAGQTQATEFADSHSDERSAVANANRCAPEKQYGKDALDTPRVSHSAVAQNNVASHATCASADKPNGSMPTRFQRTRELSSLAPSQ
jgi:hypothetical protein